MRKKILGPLFGKTNLLLCAILLLLSLYAPVNADAQKKLLTPNEFKEKLKGPILSTITAFNKNYDIDYDGMRKVIKRALDYDCKVVTVTAGNSRYDRLTYTEAKQLAKFYRTEVDNRAIFIASSGVWPVDSVMDYAKYAEEIGADALMVIRPQGYDNNTSIDSMVNLYKKIAATTKLGLVLHGYFSEELLRELVKIPSVVAMKDDMPDLSFLIHRLVMFGDRLAIFPGASDARMITGKKFGAPAYFSVLYSIAPQIGLKFWNAIKNDDYKKALEIANATDIPFIKKFSFPFWAAAIEYSGGSQRYIRPLKEELNDKQFKNMQKDIDSLNILIEPSAYKATTKQGTHMPFEWRRAGHAGGIVNGNIVITGGNNWNVEKTNRHFFNTSAIFKNGKWVSGPNLPIASCYPAFAYDASGLYIAGGTSDGNTILDGFYKLSSLKQGWEKLPSLPVPVQLARGTICDGKFYIACGQNDKTKSNKMWMFDLEHTSKGWKECSALPGEGRILPGFVTIKNSLYLLGGSGNTNLNDAYRYDTKNNSWEKLADLPVIGYAWSFQPLSDDELLVVGRAPGDLSDIGVLDLKKMQYNNIGRLSFPGTVSPLLKISENEYWLVGGEPDANKNRSEKVNVITVTKSK
ncbi:MAG: dihydrodipicolinate synthase family protein [Ginsengibacter sp.]